jgi:DNA-binding NtrC family response regulator
MQIDPFFPAERGVAAMATDPVVLVVEDDDSLRNALTRLMSHDGLCAIGVGTLEDARDEVTSHAPTLQAVIVDLGLGTESGLDLVREVHVDHPWLPVLVFSAEVDSFAREESIALGACEVLMKPAPPNAILAAVRRAIGGGAQRMAGGRARTHPSRGETRAS